MEAPRLSSPGLTLSQGSICFQESEGSDALPVLGAPKSSVDSSVGSGNARFCYFHLILLFSILDIIYHQLFLSGVLSDSDATFVNLKTAGPRN